MHALILAAGRGTRLRALHDRPKCLLEIGGIALIDRYLRGLDALAIDTTVVVGYRADDVERRIRQIGTARTVTTLRNAEFELGSVVSLLHGLRASTGPLLLLDGDVLFHPALLERIAHSRHADALLVDVGSTFTGEEYMTGADRDGRAQALQRAPVVGYHATGEWVGFAKLSAATVDALRETVERQVARGDTGGGYEDALASLLPGRSVHVEPCDDLPWIEIDFPDDVERATRCAATFDSPR
jgi:choline kinase